MCCCGRDTGALFTVNLQRYYKVPGLEIREYGRRDPSSYPRNTLYPQQLTITSLTSGGRSVGVVRSRTQTTEFLFLFIDPLSVSIFSISYSQTP
jgi:hypothetical protein